VKNLITGAKIIIFPLLEALKGNTSKDWKQTMEGFYSSQKEGYDSFRERLLRGRSILMNVFPIGKRGGIIWVDIGGGTARNLEFFPVDIIRQYFKTIYIVDISPSLLHVARDRVKKLGLEAIVKIVEADCTHPSFFSQFPSLLGSVDVVTMSYSLSMIPDNVAAIRHSLKLLKPAGKGILGIADFLLYSKDDDCLSPFQSFLRQAERNFHRKWFAMDHVHLLPPSILQIIASHTVPLWDHRFRGTIPFLPGFRPIHGVLLFATK